MARISKILCILCTSVFLFACCPVAVFAEEIDNSFSYSLEYCDPDGNPIQTFALGDSSILDFKVMPVKNGVIYPYSDSYYPLSDDFIRAYSIGCNSGSYLSGDYTFLNSDYGYKFSVSTTDGSIICDVGDNVKFSISNFIIWLESLGKHFCPSDFFSDIQFDVLINGKSFFVGTADQFVSSTKLHNNLYGDVDSISFDFDFNDIGYPQESVSSFDVIMHVCSAGFRQFLTTEHSDYVAKNGTNKSFSQIIGFGTIGGDNYVNDNFSYDLIEVNSGGDTGGDTGSGDSTGDGGSTGDNTGGSTDSESGGIVIQCKDYSEQLETAIYILRYILGILIFFVVILLCKYVYSFFNMFF